MDKLIDSKAQSLQWIKSLETKKKINKKKKKMVTHKGTPIKLSADFSTEGEKGLAWDIQSDEKQGPRTTTTLPDKAIIEN